MKKVEPQPVDVGVPDQSVAAGAPPAVHRADGLRILMLEDSPFDADLTLGVLEAAGYQCTCRRVDTREGFEAELDQPEYDVVLADHNLPNFDGLSALRLFRERDLKLPFIFVSGTLGEERAIESLKAGATDYVLKNHLARLGPVVARALRELAEHRFREQAEAARQEEAEIAAALARVGRALIASLDAPELLKRLCEVSTEVLNADFSHTVLRETEGGPFVAAQGSGHTTERWEVLQALRIPPETLAPLLMALRETDVLAVTAASGARAQARDDKAPHEVRSGAYAALRRGDEVLGVLAVGRNDDVPFSRAERRIAEGIAQLASLALANARAVEELARVSQLKSDFVATMSHELRTPLNVIIGYDDLLLDDEFGPVSKDQRDVLRRIGTSARHLLDLVNATLDLGRLESGRLPLSISEVVVGTLVSEVVKDLQPCLDAKPSIQIQVEVPDRVLKLHTDEAKLKIVLKNVLDNAIKFSDAGKVLLSLSERSGGVEFTVTDPGVGIAPEVLPIIFEPFRQGETSMTRRFGGVGLGLYIVHRLLDTLGGRVSVDSRIGDGTTVRVWVPGGAT